MNNLIDYLDSFQPMSAELRAFLNEKVIAVSFPARHTLLEVPKVASHLYYIKQGFAMSYSYGQDGKVTENFWKVGEVAVAFESFVFQRPSLEVIQLVVPSDLCCLSYESMMEMFRRFPEANGMYRLLMNQHYVRLQRRLKMLKYADYPGQYQKLLERFRGIEQIVTQRSIATYLGIAPQTLARIKRFRPEAN
jgi:CRP-like cAMP-binding protein